MYNCAIVGAGEIVDDIHIPALRGVPQVRVVAVCESNPERAAWFQQRHKVPIVFRDLSDLLANRDGVDFVDIATPPHTHYAQVKQALEAGLHVLVEKPLALSAAAAEELGWLAVERGLKLCSFQSYRFRDSVLRAAEARKSGALGTLQQMTVVSHGDDPFPKRSGWGWDERGSKLLLYELGIHYLDLAVQFGGPVREIVGFRATIDPVVNAVTQINAILEHHGGVTTMLDLQVLSASNFVHVELFGSSQDVLIKFFPEAFRISSGQISPLGEVQNDVSRILNVALPTIRERFKAPIVKRRAVPHHRILEGFVRSLRHPDIDPPVSASSVIPTLELLDALHARLESINPARWSALEKQ